MNKYDQYQIPCLYNIRKAREGGARKAFVVMAGGLGKTIVAAREVGDFLQSGRKRVLFLCHDLGILMQNRRRFEEILGDEYSFGFFYGEQKDLGYCDLLFATFQTMGGVSNGKAQFSRDEFAYVVVDEAHHSRAETFEDVLDYFQPEFRLGLTATPEREDGKNLAEYFGEPVFTLDFVEAWARGFLTPVEYVLVTREMVDIEQYLEHERRIISREQLNKQVFVTMSDDDLVRDILSRVSDLEHPRMIIFCNSIEHTERIAKVYPGAKALHSSLPREIQLRILSDFRDGKLEVIVVCDKLNEGIDVPAVDVIVRLRLTGSKLLFEQQLSRGLRLYGGKEKVRVYDYASSIEQLELLFDYEEKLQKTERTATSSGGSERTYSPRFSITLSGGKFVITKVDLKELIKRGSVASHRYTRDELIGAMQRKAREINRTPTMRDMDQDEKMPSSGAFVRCFGTFENAQRAAGLRPCKHKWSKDEVVQFIRKLGEFLGRAPVSSDIDFSLDEDSTSLQKQIKEIVPCSLDTIQSLCGTWNNALEEAGFPKPVSVCRNEDEILNRIIGFVDRHGRLPIRVEIERDLKIDAKRIKQRFGMQEYRGSFMEFYREVIIPKLQERVVADIVWDPTQGFLKKQRAKAKIQNESS